MAWTTAELVTQITRYAYLPTGHPSYTDAILLDLADQVLGEEVLTALHSRGSDYGIAVADFAITADRQAYRLPSRAAFGTIRDVTLLDASGRSLGRLPWLELEELDGYAGLTGGPTYAGVVVVDDVLRLVPTPSSPSGTLRVRYFRRPGTLTAPSTAADTAPHAITAGATTTQITIGTHAFSANSGHRIDLIQANPPFAVLAQDVPLTAVDGTSVTIATAVTDAAVGDYVCLTGTTPIPAIPAELHPVLARGVASQILEESGSIDRAMLARQRYEASLERVLRQMAPRVQGQPDRVVNRTSSLGRRR